MGKINYKEVWEGLPAYQKIRFFSNMRKELYYLKWEELDKDEKSIVRKELYKLLKAE